ncbi:MAG: beta-1,6-N-acetylglucosaminyltransferase [Puia sp.]|nr:beta-1,6-N-acetylglucosaminyltransferase [Puia sp.]
MRLAHLILAHNNPPQLERLVKRLIYENTDIFIHLDAKADKSEFAEIERLPNTFFVANRTKVSWADYNMITATLNGIKEILKTGNDYSHINLLSGADYPLKDPASIQKFLFENPDTTFMRFKHVYNEWQESKSRFTLYHFGDYRLPLKWQAQSLANKLLPERKLPNGLEPYGFSQWFTMTPACARYTLEYLEKHAAVRRFFRMTWAADELFFQTILLNSPLKDTIVNDHLRYIKFKRAACNPETLTYADKDALINSGKFYARKFDAARDATILDYLDQVTSSQPMVH